MSQTLKKIKAIFNHFILKPWSLLFLLFFTLLFIFFTLLMGPALWFQSFVLCALCVGWIHWLFYRLLTNSFEHTLLKGYDPWHLRPLIDQYTPDVLWAVCEHPVPFVFSFDFYAIKKIIISQSLLTHLKKEEIQALAQYQGRYFRCHQALWFTKISFVLFIFLFPLHYLARLKWIGAFFSKIILWIRLPFKFWLHQAFYRMDRLTAGSDKDQYCNLLWKLESFLNVSSFKIPALISLLPPVSSHCLHPPLKERIKKMSP